MTQEERLEESREQSVNRLQRSLLNTCLILSGTVVGLSIGTGLLVGKLHKELDEKDAELDMLRDDLGLTPIED